jgi:hypothetical protein
MATSAAMNTSNDRVKYKITITQNSQNVNGNTSNVTVSVRFYRTNTGYTTYGSGTVYCKINGTTYSASVTPSQKITNSGIVLFTKTLNISHNADGTKTLTTSAWINLNTPLTSSEQSYSQALTTIPRATTPAINVATVALGGSITISMPRASSSFTHTLTYKFGSASGTIGTGLGTSTTWTVPLNLASQIPNTTSGVLTVTCVTYNGSTKIGTKTDTVTCTVPASVVPTISTIAIAETVSGLAAKIGAFVQGQSLPSVTITAAGAYGSSITSYITKIGSSSYNGASFTMKSLNVSGTVAVTVTVKDSRGRTATKTQNITVLAYQIPEISAFTGIRCNQDGSANDEGQYVQLSYAYEISPLNNKNDKTITIQYRQVGAANYTTLKTESNYSANTTYVPTTVFSVDNSYEFKITVADYFKTVKFDLEVTTAFTLADYSAGGRGMAIGKVAESEDLLDVALPILARGGLSFLAIPGGTDLNNVMAPGSYGSAETASSYDNCPITSGTFTLEVMAAGDEGQIYQRLTYASKVSAITYERLYYGGSWGSWNKLNDFDGVVLWSGAMYMTSGHTATLKEPVSAQPNGISLVFSTYASGAAVDANFADFFIAKTMVAQKPGGGHTFIMSKSNFESVASKYLYINDGSITGHDNNTKTGTANGITYANNAFVLRYVIGV